MIEGYVIKFAISINVDIATLGRLFRTCKSWYRLSKEEYFWKQRLEKDFEYTFTEEVGSHLSKYKRMYGSGILHYYPNVEKYGKWMESRLTFGKNIWASQILETHEDNPRVYYLTPNGELKSLDGKVILNGISRVHSFNGKFLYFENFQEENWCIDLDIGKKHRFSKDKILKMHQFYRYSIILTASHRLYYKTNEFLLLSKKVKSFETNTDTIVILFTNGDLISHNFPLSVYKKTQVLAKNVNLVKIRSDIKFINENFSLYSKNLKLADNIIDFDETCPFNSLILLDNNYTLTFKNRKMYNIKTMFCPTSTNDLVVLKNLR